MQENTEVTVVVQETDIKTLLENEFGIGSVMVDIAKCESGYRQFDKDGNVLRGEQNSLDIGLYQINEYYHLEASKKFGVDIYTLEGNISYAKYLYATQGVQPWAWSNDCHRSTPTWGRGSNGFTRKDYE